MWEGVHHAPRGRVAVQAGEETENILLLQLAVPAGGGNGPGGDIHKLGE